MSIWVLSNQDFFSTKVATGTSIVNSASIYLNATQIYGRINQDHTFPLFVLMILVIATRLFVFFMHRIVKLLRFTCNFCFGDTSKREAFLEEYNRAYELSHAQRQVTTYPRAVERNIIKGLATYNILQNPLYKELFGITWRFALEHQHVRSVQFSKGAAASIQDDIEGDAAQIDMLTRNRLLRMDQVYKGRPPSSGIVANFNTLSQKNTNAKYWDAPFRDPATSGLPPDTLLATASLTPHSSPYSPPVITHSMNRERGLSPVFVRGGVQTAAHQTTPTPTLNPSPSASARGHNVAANIKNARGFH